MRDVRGQTLGWPGNRSLITMCQGLRGQSKREAKPEDKRGRREKRQVRQMEKDSACDAERARGQVAYLSKQVLVQAVTSQQHLALVLATLKLKVLALSPQQPCLLFGLALL